MKRISNGVIAAIAGGVLVPVLAAALHARSGPPVAETRTGWANLQDGRGRSRWGHSSEPVTDC